MSYFRTSYSTLQAIAKHGRYEDVAGFLVLARHASGLPHAGFDSYKLSGVGVNGIHEKAGLSEETARGVIERLQEQDVIRAVSAETRRAFYHARWEITSNELDIDLPHALIDSSKDGAIDSALRRFKKHRIVTPSYSEKLSKVSDSELRLDALMLLIESYHRTSMSAYGGISPTCIFRKWDVKSKTRKSGGTRWGAEPDHKTSSVAYTHFMAESLNHLQKKKKIDLSEEFKARFWNAWNTICETGLVYEAVSLYDTDPSNNEKACLQFTARVNDYHAGSIIKTGDPSLLRTLESKHGSKFAYYTPAQNERGEPEAMWVILPDERGVLVGVWRPRFRANNKDSGLWIEIEEAAIAETIANIETNAIFE